jgi:hypothetical protein
MFFKTCGSGILGRKLQQGILHHPVIDTDLAKFAAKLIDLIDCKTTVIGQEGSFGGGKFFRQFGYDLFFAAFFQRLSSFLK